MALGEEVTVEIFEGVKDEPKWPLEFPQASETYTEPAFGLVVLPTKYNERGVRADRRLPLIVRATGKATLPQGTQKLLVRARMGSRLFMDGKEIASTKFPDLRADGHEEVPESPKVLAPGIRLAQPGQFETLVEIEGDGKEHVFVLEAMVGLKERRPEIGEVIASFSSDNDHFYLLGPQEGIPFTEDAWVEYERERREHHRKADSLARREKSKTEQEYWNFRHELARKAVAELPEIRVPEVKNRGFVNNEIDSFIQAKLEDAGVEPAPLLEDLAFLRRAALDTTGIIPTPTMIEQYLGAKGNRREQIVDALLQHPGWADHWVSYWQDVLAENPGIVKPMLNNTGPFRWYLHEAFTDNRAMDRFATDLMMMEGSVYYGGPAGFSMASQNDVPMAAKAQIVSQAFLGMQMQCARCHDAPFHHFVQKDLFSLAAMLKRDDQKVPLSSSIPTNANITIGRVVNVTLAPGSEVAPGWPFKDEQHQLAAGVLRNEKDSRERMAALVTNPANERFAKVIVNRIWKRYLGWGIVEPVDDWESSKASHPELLEWLARELVTHDYDLKHIARLILNSQAYQREATIQGSKEAKPDKRLFASPARRRMTAEQVVDSLFAAAGKQMNVEEMNMDVDGRRPVKDFINLGRPERAWQYTSRSNERDRPALALPKAQAVNDMLVVFGWRESRQSPLTIRDDSPNVVQPASLANGVLTSGRISRLSDDSAITELALTPMPLPDLIDTLFQRVLTRSAKPEELKAFTAYLTPGYDQRVLEEYRGQKLQPKPTRAVSWSNHLNPQATTIKQQLEKEAREGDPATQRLRPEWRERMEDVLWAVVNSPEFVFVP